VLAALGCVAVRNRRRGVPWTLSTAVAVVLGFVACWAITLSLVTLVPPRWLLNPLAPPLLAGAIAWGTAAVAERRPFPIRGRVFRRTPLEPTPVLAAIGPVGDVPPDDRTATTSPASSARPIEIFFSYAREDEKLLNQLAAHMSLMERNGLVVL